MSSILDVPVRPTSRGFAWKLARGRGPVQSQRPPTMPADCSCTAPPGSGSRASMERAARTRRESPLGTGQVGASSASPVAASLSEAYIAQQIRSPLCWASNFGRYICFRCRGPGGRRERTTRTASACVVWLRAPRRAAVRHSGSARTSRPIRRRSHSFATCAAGLHAPGSVTATTAAAMPPTVSTTE